MMNAYIYLAIIILPTNTLGQQCRSWADVCDRKCREMNNLLPRLFTCEDCLDTLCGDIKVPEDICRKFLGTTCGQKEMLNCNIPGSVKEILDCDFDDEDRGEINKPPLPPIPQTATEPNTPDDSNQTTVIVIAVCVSVVVVLIAVLITAVYCWRVRRKTMTKKQPESVDHRNKAFTNDSYRRGREVERARPDSTYNTINDLHIEHDHHVLDAKGSCKESTVNSSSDLDRDKGEKNPNSNEYNRLKFNKTVVKSNDPSYSHTDGVDTYSDYDSTADKLSTATTAYQYGVPIRIKDIEKLQAEHKSYDSNVDIDNDSQGSNEGNSSEVKKSTDQTDVHLENKRENRNSNETKPRAVVTPMVKNDELQLPIRIKNKNVSNEKGESKGTGEIYQIGVENSRNDDYEISVINGGLNDDGIVLNGSKCDFKTIQIQENPKKLVTDDYEIAVIQNDCKSDNKTAGENLKSKVPIVKNTETKSRVVTDDYEIAIVQKVDKNKNAGVDKEIIEEDEQKTKETTIDTFDKSMTDKSPKSNDDYEIAVL